MSKTLYKIKQNKKTKKTESSTVSSRGHSSHTVQYNHDRLVIVKRRSEKYNLQLVTERRQRRCIPHMQYDRLFHARAEATGKARSPSERLVDATSWLCQ